jgi:hypothetical protein
MKKINMILFVALMTTLILVQNVYATGMTVSLSKYEPYPASPGQTVKVWLLVKNIGNTDLKDVTIEAIPQSPFTPYNQESKKTIEILGAYKDYLIDFNLKVDSDAVEGYNNLKIRYGFTGGAIQEKNIEIYVQTKDATLTIEDVIVNPGEISPGSDGTLTLVVRNDAPTAMTDLNMKLQLQAIIGSTIVDLPFAPIDSSAEKRIFMLEPGKSAQFTYNLRVYPDAVSKVYKIPFTLTYYDGLGNEKEKSDYIGIIVNGVPDMSTVIDKTDLTMQNRNGMISLKVINKGVSDIKFLNVILEDTSDYDILSNSRNVYVGNLVSDDYQTIEYRLNILSKEDKILFPVTLQYRDSNNKYYEEKINVEFLMIDGKKLNPGKGIGGYSWITIILLLLVVGGFWYYRRKCGRSNKKGQFYQ